MPYNTTAIPPRKEVTGQVQLPLSRVKKIIAVDPSINICSNNAAFAITIATELFVQYLSEQAQQMAKIERKPRRNVQYKDLSNAVQHHDNLEFLEDVIPKTVPYKQIKEQVETTRAKLRGEKAADGQQGAQQKRQQLQQRRLPNGKKPRTSGANGSIGGVVNGLAESSRSSAAPAPAPAQDEDPNAQLEMEMRQAAEADVDGDVDMAGTG